MAHFVAGYHYQKNGELVTTVTSELEQFPDAEKIEQAKLILGKLKQKSLGPCPPESKFQSFDDEDTQKQIWEGYGHSSGWTISCIAKV